MLSYRVRLMLIGGVVTIALLGTIFLQAPAPTLTVEELLDNSSDHLDEFTGKCVGWFVKLSAYIEIVLSPSRDSTAYQREVYQATVHQRCVAI